MTVTVTKLFDTYAQAKSAVEDLERGGISHRDISIIANNADGTVQVDRPHTGAGVGAATGGAAGGVVGLLTGLGLLAIPGVGPVVAAGWLVAAGTAALVGAGAGGLVGSLTDHGVSKDEAEILAEAVRRGGALVAVKVADKDVDKTEAILQRHDYVDLQDRSAAYREAGWSGFDPTLTAPYEPTEAERRARDLK